jgi:hypothetical protein
MHEAVAGCPSNVDMEDASANKDQMAALAAFQGQVRAVRAATEAERMRRAQALAKAYGVPPITPQVALALALLLRDCVDAKDDWSAVLAFIDALTPELAAQADLQEHRAFAFAHTGKDVEAIGALETLGRPPNAWG